MKLRIAAVLALGAGLIGFAAWPLIATPTPFDTVSAATETIEAADLAICVALGFAAGFIGYLLSWPFGKQVAVLAAPAGLAVWAFRSGNIANMTQQYPTVEFRTHIYSIFMWEPVLWLLVVLAGFVGVIAAHKLFKAKTVTLTNDNPVYNKFLNPLAAFAVSVIVVVLLTPLLAQSVRLKGYAAQPSAGQIFFAVVAAFAAASFLAKLFLNADFLWTVLASGAITAVAVISWANGRAFADMADIVPPVFFTNTLTAILPIQMVAFGTIGAIGGYWLAVRYSLWKKQQP
ncbi:MAG: hypothetical protein PHF37_09665 [Phycisphaerae bacterium]|nr:hypothetical protein [Phycisphaerae bacterium]